MSDAGVESASALPDAAAWLAAIDALPPEVDAKARLLLLDTFGCLLAGLRHPEVRQFGQALRLAFPGDTAWPTSEIKLGAAGLAALGAAAACWDEACEGNSSAHGRPGLPVVPALLALSATHDVSLGDLLVALVTGYEIGARAGQAWRIPPGWHVDGSWHSLGVAAAVARLTAGPHAIQPAIEAAACQIPASLYLPIAAGSVLRNTYPAHAVLLGMLSASAAAAGFEMPRDAFDEARRRVLRATDPASVTPAGEWTILAGYLKPFAGVRHTHYGVEAALRLRRHRAFSLERDRSRQAHDLSRGRAVLRQSRAAHRHPGAIQPVVRDRRRARARRSRSQCLRRHRRSDHHAAGAARCRRGRSGASAPRRAGYDRDRRRAFHRKRGRRRRRSRDADDKRAGRGQVSPLCRADARRAGHRSVNSDFPRRRRCPTGARMLYS